MGVVIKETGINSVQDHFMTQEEKEKLFEFIANTPITVPLVDYKPTDSEYKRNHSLDVNRDNITIVQGPLTHKKTTFID